MGILSSFTGESEVTLKRLNPTRWSGRLTSLMGVKHRYPDVLKALTHIILMQHNKDERDEASRLKKCIERLEFVFLLVVMTKILGEINVASQYLQNKDADLQRAADHLYSADKNLSELRSKFDTMKEEAVTVCNKWGVAPTFEQKRKSKRKRHFDELAEDSRLTDPEDCFRINVFYAVLDIVNSQLKQRFAAMLAVNEKFSVLNPAVLSQLDEFNIMQKATKLQEDYPDDLSSAFPIQLACFRASMKTEIDKATSVKCLAKMLIVDYAALSSAFSDVITALLLFLTLPVTVATAERSFSKLKIIKNYLRNSMGQERLRGLSLLAIEAARAKTMDTDDLINQFAEMKARKVDCH
jgi:hAT family C-terminal dimerisation region